MHKLLCWHLVVLFGFSSHRLDPNHKARGDPYATTCDHLFRKDQGQSFTGYWGVQIWLWTSTKNGTTLSYDVLKLGVNPFLIHRNEMNFLQHIREHREEPSVQAGAVTLCQRRAGSLQRGFARTSSLFTSVILAAGSKHALPQTQKMPVSSSPSPCTYSKLQSHFRLWLHSTRTLLLPAAPVQCPGEIFAGSWRQMWICDNLPARSKNWTSPPRGNTCQPHL